MIKKRNNIIRLLLFIFTQIQITCPIDTASPASGDPIWQIVACTLENNTCTKSSLDTLDTQGPLSILDEITNTLITLESNLDILESEIDAHPRIITGHINTQTGIIAGSGFSFASGPTGQATITFDTAFNSTPIVVATLEDPNTTSGTPASISSITTSNFLISTYDTTGITSPPHPLSDTPDVFFVAIGT